jgi:methylated-DNA-[protein]-cysteine S-methyltransferase
MNHLYLHEFNTSIGWFRIAATEKGLAFISFADEDSARFRNYIERHFGNYAIVSGGKENKKAERQIKAYLSSKLKKFSLRLDIQTTPFRRKVLKQVAAVPYGRTSTYGEIAAAVGDPGASRAVGSANANNPLPIIIPCHRVVASNGLGGYGGGINLKKYLLNLEGAGL